MYSGGYSLSVNKGRKGNASIVPVCLCHVKDVTAVSRGIAMKCAYTEGVLSAVENQVLGTKIESGRV